MLLIFDVRNQRVDMCRMSKARELRQKIYRTKRVSSNSRMRTIRINAEQANRGYKLS